MGAVRSSGSVCLTLSMALLCPGNRCSVEGIEAGVNSARLWPSPFRCPNSHRRPTEAMMDRPVLGWMPVVALLSV